LGRTHGSADVDAGAQVIGGPLDRAVAGEDVIDLEGAQLLQAGENVAGAEVDHVGRVLHEHAGVAVVGVVVVGPVAHHRVRPELISAPVEVLPRLALLRHLRRFGVPSYRTLAPALVIWYTGGHSISTDDRRIPRSCLSHFLRNGG
jgi:hypothetical protein